MLLYVITNLTQIF